MRRSRLEPSLAVVHRRVVKETEGLVSGLAYDLPRWTKDWSVVMMFLVLGFGLRSRNRT